MKHLYSFLTLFLASMLAISCSNESPKDLGKTAAEILGNPDYHAISFGGYRQNSRDIQPTIAQLKDDMKILHAMGVRMIRMYNVYLAETENVLKAIRELKKEDPTFEMYMMMGAWIDCKNAWTDLPDRIRDEESPRNAAEIKRAVNFANEYPDIVKVIAVGNEAMVKWAWNYYVEPAIILKWVNHLQKLKKDGKLPKDLWITSSDNFASWGGGSDDYHVEDLNELIRSVDFLSVHTYPMHDTHYNPDFWGVRQREIKNSDQQKIDSAMVRARDYAIAQFGKVKKYMNSLGVDKPMHIGETGWATISSEFYGAEGARAIDEYKSGFYYKMMREWTDKEGISMFYFEAFDEPWKDAANPEGSENHFGLINLNAEAKYAIWDLVDAGVFEGITRDGKPITKTFGGDKEAMMKTVLVPPTNKEIQARKSKEN